MKDIKSYYFGSFGDPVDTFLLQQLPKPITFHSYEVRDINNRLCSVFCLDVLHLIERIDPYNAVLKLFVFSIGKCR